MKTRKQTGATGPDEAAGRRPGREIPPRAVTVTSTEAQNAFGGLLDLVARDEVVFITRRSAAKAVVISVERYEALTGSPQAPLDTLTAEFDALLDGMQAPGVRAAARDAFGASPEELGRAAVAAADRREE